MPLPLKPISIANTMPDLVGRVSDVVTLLNTGLDASSLTGNVADARLSSNIPRLNANVSFGANVTFGANTTFNGTAQLFAGDIFVNGVVRLTGGQIGFPGTQIPSAEANVLDDYEEGDWTPFLGGTSESSQTYAFQSGCYVKIGKQVWATGVLGFTNIGTISGNLLLKGFPFVVGPTTSDRAMASTYWANMNTPFVYLTAVPEAGQSVASLYGAAGAVSSLGGLTSTALTNSSSFVFTVTYRAAN